MNSPFFYANINQNYASNIPVMNYNNNQSNNDQNLMYNDDSNIIQIFHNWTSDTAFRQLLRLFNRIGYTFTDFKVIYDNSNEYLMYSSVNSSYTSAVLE